MSTVAGASREAFHDWVEAALAESARGERVPFATVLRETGAPVGSSSFLSIRPEHGVIEIGHTWVGLAARGGGANVEAKLLMLRHAFERCGARRVEFKTDALNERSRAALAALPAQFEGVFRKHMLVRGGENRDSAWFSVLDDDWPEVERSLERRLDRKLG